MGKHEPRTGKGVAVKPREKLACPRLFKVILHNDHYTTMDFVVDVLMEIFGKTQHEAYRIMLDVHRNGTGLCGVYTFEMAETKVDQVHCCAREHGYPLRCSMEPE